MIGIMGAGAFGRALAQTFRAEGRDVILWGRKADVRQNAADLRGADVILLAVPMQALGQVIAENPDAFAGQPLIACCKGVDLVTLTGPSAVITARRPDARVGVLTGPSFAADIAAGLPTALTLAFRGAEAGALQALLSTKTLRLYHSTDILGAELGGALKNVIAIAAGIVIGAGLGDSARAALMTRGFVEMQRLALTLARRPELLTAARAAGRLTPRDEAFLASQP